jgi:hypothetical protein
MMERRYGISQDISASFNSMRDGFPFSPPGKRIKRIQFTNCRAHNGGDTYLSLVRVDQDTPGGASPDQYGIYKSSWWKIVCPSLPVRLMNLTMGHLSLQELIRRYGFIDTSGCVNHRDTLLIYESSSDPLPMEQLPVQAHMRKATGVPQFYPNSGICWYAALCTVTFSDPKVRDFVKQYFPSDIASLCNTCLFNRDDAQKLRNELWEQYGVGDDIRKPPEEDGCNGFSEFTLLCAKTGIPLLRYMEEDGKMLPMSCSVREKVAPYRQVKCAQPKDLSQPHFLVLRFQDGDHTKKFPLLRRIETGGRRYRLVGFYGGHKKCGHQVGVASCTGHWRDMIYGDADMHKSGIGLMHIPFYENLTDMGKDHWKENWLPAFEKLIPVTKFQRGEFCNMTPWNPNDDSLNRFRASETVQRQKYRASKSSQPGSLSLDKVYFLAS